MTLIRTFEQVKSGKVFRKKLKKRVAKKYYNKQHIDFILKFDIGDVVFLDQIGFLTIKDITPIFEKLCRVVSSRHKSNNWFLSSFKVYFVEKEITDSIHSYDFEDIFLHKNNMSYEEFINDMKSTMLKDLCYYESNFKIPYLVISLPKEKVLNENLTYKKDFLEKLKTEYAEVKFMPWPLIDQKEKCFCFL
jgi:hypothetical protein